MAVQAAPRELLRPVLEASCSRPQRAAHKLTSDLTEHNAQGLGRSGWWWVMAVGDCWERGGAGVWVVVAGRDGKRTGGSGRRIHSCLILRPPGSRQDLHRSAQRIGGCLFVSVCSPMGIVVTRVSPPGTGELQKRKRLSQGKLVW